MKKNRVKLKITKINWKKLLNKITFRINIYYGIRYCIVHKVN